MIQIAWQCDYCKKTGLVVSRAGIIYCPNCKKSNGTKIEVE